MRTRLITGTLALASVLASVAACGGEGMEDQLNGDESALEKGRNRNGSGSGSSSGSTTTTTTTTTSSSTCVDTWNPVDSTCAQQKDWGNCKASWMGTQCQATCGQCSSSSTTTATATTSTTPPATAAVCTDPDGTNAVLSALAVSMGMELRRWQSSRDLYTDGWMVYLSNEGKSRCPNGNCVNTQALLDMQKDQAINQVRMPSGVYMYPPSLRSRLVAKYGEQKVCESRPDNHTADNCPAEEHQLTFQYSAPGSCDTNFFFEAKKTDGSPLQYPAQLKNKLLFADHTNAYVNFQNNGEIVSIDPTYGLNEGGSTSSGSCSAACTKVSAANIAGQCCTCAGATKTYVRSAFSAVVYLCQ